MSAIRVYDQNMERIAYLDKAYDISYDLKLNELWYAGFKMPADDIKNKYLKPFNYVEIFDGDERVELFRIMPTELTRSEQGEISYQCEHVLATLIDDVMFKYHQIGNIGIGTQTVLRYILDRQITKRWQLLECDFDRRFEYKWENENLLAALFSVPATFKGTYKWEYDTTGYPWRISLKALPKDFNADIMYKKNMLSVTKSVDPTTVVTRLYLLGYGEGDNQLNIEQINGGKPYIDADTISTWGIKSSIVSDRRFENAETLKAYGEKLLSELKNPYKSYSVSAVDLYKLNKQKYAKFKIGDIVRIVDKEDGIKEDLPIVAISKSDITGGEINIEIANKSRDLAGSISDLTSRTRINEVYAQGATNQLIVPFADNADPSNPAKMRVYIPDTMARINKLVLNFKLEPFRAYSKAIEGGGSTSQSTSAGGASTQTSSAGGGTTTSTSAGGATTQTSSAGGGSTQTSSAGGGSTQTSSAGGGSTESTDSVDSEYKSTTSEEIIFTTAGPIDVSGSWHRHGAISAAHDHKIVIPGHSHKVTIPSHRHSLNIPNHTHTLNIPNHTHRTKIPAHTHSVTISSHAHTITLPNHAHKITLPNHTHKINFGIYQGTKADSAIIKVDGKAVGTFNPNIDINIIDYLAVDGAGKIKRNTWHEIEIVPDKMTRIAANIFMQIFTNSRGGGDY